MALARAKAAGLPYPQGDELTVLWALTDWFRSAEAVAATTLPEELVAQIADLGIDKDSIIRIGEMVLAKPMSGRTRAGSPDPFPAMPATRRVASEEPEMRARYLLAAARRLSEADDKAVAVRKEETYLDEHVAAGRNRRRAACRVDEVSKESPVMVWRTAGDNRVDSRCRALEGRLFGADTLPGGQIPGAMHPRCRCRAEPAGHGPILNWGAP